MKATGPVRRPGERPGERPVPLVDFVARGFADRTASRLRAEGIAAEVWEAGPGEGHTSHTPPPIGPTVMVRQRDHAEAAVLVRLFAEVDEGRSAVAPPPRSLWVGPWPRITLGLLFLVVLVGAIVVLAVAALPA